MKIWSSFVKELKIAARGFYFYVELLMAFILLFVLLFVVPENFAVKEEEFLYLNFPQEAYEEQYIATFEDADEQAEPLLLKVGPTEIAARLYENDESKIYLLDSEADMVALAEDRHKIGAAVSMDADDLELHYSYYLQGNETPRLKGLLKILHGQDDAALFAAAENQDVRRLAAAGVELNDREHLLPVFLAFNGSLMGFFIIAAYIFLDKKEGVIKAYAITPSPVWQYLLSKVMVLTVTMLLTSLLMIVPLMGFGINYAVLIIFLLATGLFASGLGLVLAGYFDDIVKSFAVMFLLMIALMLPTLSYFSPSWNPPWLQYVPSYYIIFGFHEIFVKGEMGFVLLISLAYLAVSALLFAWANLRFKRTLSV